MRKILCAVINAECKIMRNILYQVLYTALIIIMSLCPAVSGTVDFYWIVEPSFQNAESFSNGMAAVMTEEKYGYINSSGELVIKPSYDEAGDFYNDTAPVINNGLRLYINNKGMSVIIVREDESRYFGEGLAVVKINGRYGYLNSSGKFVLKPAYEDAISFSEGFAAVKINGKYGFINKKGKIIIRPVYEKASIFSEGVAAVKIKNTWGYINKRGVTVVKNIYAEAGDFRSGLAPVKVDSGFGYINIKGEFVINPQFESAAQFTESIAAVKLNGRWGYIKINDKRKMREKKIISNIEVVQDTKKVSETEIKKSGLYTGEVKDSGSNENISVKNLQGKKTPRVEDNRELSRSENFKDTGDIVDIDKNIPVIKGMEYVGKLSEMNAGQVVIIDSKTGGKVYLGAWCITKVYEDRIYIEAGTPFSAVTKCDLKEGFYGDIKPGMNVYKKNK